MWTVPIGCPLPGAESGLGIPNREGWGSKSADCSSVAGKLEAWIWGGAAWIARFSHFLPKDVCFTAAGTLP